MSIALTMVGVDIDHPEAVCWDPGGAIIVGTEAGLVLWLDPGSGTVIRSVTVGTGFVGGLALDAAGRVYACDAAARRIQRVEADGSVTTYSAGPPEGFVLPNFPVFDAAGRLFVSDSGDWDTPNGSVVVIEPGGGEARTVSREPSAFTNGLAISPDGSALHVAESTFPGVSRLALLADGTLGPREVVVEMPRTVPDGLAFTADGGLLVACYRPDAIYLWDGERLELLVDDWTGVSLCSPTNVAFGGPDLDQLWSANLGATYITRVDAGLRGASLNYPEIP
jgi:gluconolactonase